MVKQAKYDNTLFVIMENFADMCGDDRTGGGGSRHCLPPPCVVVPFQSASETSRRWHSDGLVVRMRRASASRR
eukprot:6538329-Prymnesium_polylepis.1